MPPAPRRRRWLTLLLGLMIFACGMVVGGGTALIVLKHHLVHAIHHPEDAPARIAARLRWKLGLSDQQTAEVTEIVRARQKALMAIRRGVQPRVVAELDRAEAEIAAVLDAAQQEKWHALFARLRADWLPPLPEESGASVEH